MYQLPTGTEAEGRNCAGSGGCNWLPCHLLGSVRWQAFGPTKCLGNTTVLPQWLQTAAGW